MKAGNSEKSSYRYAILFFFLELLLLLRTRLRKQQLPKKERPKQNVQKDLAKFGNSGDFFSNLSDKKNG